MDWSLLQRKSPYPFLRPELLYDHWQVGALSAMVVVLLTNGVKIYYVAIVLILSVAVCI
jgi:hypothetical protein